MVAEVWWQRCGGRGVVAEEWWQRSGGRGDRGRCWGVVRVREGNAGWECRLRVEKVVGRRRGSG